jgi:hypothetical protein
LLKVGDVSQDPNLYYQMQEWIEATAVKTSVVDGDVYFVNHDAPTVAPPTEYYTFLQPFKTWASFCEIAGLNYPEGNGFRRKCYEDSAFEIGKIRWDEKCVGDDPNDIRGPWCFEDLQKAFSALRWGTINSIGGYVRFKGKGYADENEQDWLPEAEAKAWAEDQYGSFTPVTNPSANIEAYTWMRGVSGGYYKCGKARVNQYHTIQLGARLATAIDTYVIANKFTFWDEVFTMQGDADGVAEGALSLFQSQPAVAGEVELKLGSEGWITPPVWVPFGYSGLTTTARGYYTSVIRHLVKWQFTHDAAPT